MHPVRDHNGVGELAQLFLNLGLGTRGTDHDVAQLALWDLGAMRSA